MCYASVESKSRRSRGARTAACRYRFPIRIVSAALLARAVRAGVIAGSGRCGRRRLRRRDVVARELQLVAAPVVQHLDRAVELHVRRLLGKERALVLARLGMFRSSRGRRGVAVLIGGCLRSLQDAIVLEVMQQVAFANLGVLIDRGAFLLQ